MTNVSLASGRDLRTGLVTSFKLLSVQWGLRRSVKSRIVLSVVLSVVLLIMALAAHVGDFVKYVALERDGVVQSYALNYLAAFQRGELGTIGAIAFGICLLSALVSPFTGATSTSLIPVKELSGVSVSTWHRFTDAFVSQIASSISILQLLTLTALSSMMTLDSGRVVGLLFTWSIWLVLVCLTVLALWLAEYTYRRFGKKSRIAILSSLAGLLALALAIDPDHGSTVFGIGTLYADVVKGIGDYSAGQAFGAVLAVLAFGGVIVYLSSVFASITLSLPERTTARGVSEVYRGKGAIKRHSFTAISVRSIIRLPEVRKPIVSAAVIGVVITMIAPQTFSVASTFSVVIPLVTALAWGSNAFAHIGGGMTWLITQPNALKNAPWKIFGIQLAISVSLFCFVWLPSLIAGRSTLESFGLNFCALVASSLIVARSATTKSVKKPAPTHFGARSESTLSPTMALKYTLVLSLWGGQFGVLFLAVDNTLIRMGMLASAIIWQSVHMIQLQEYWNSMESRRKVAMAVAND